MTARYHQTRFADDERRTVLWQSLWRYHFSREIAPEACVLELGSGYGSFINSVVARRRIAVDVWPEHGRYLTPGVEAVVGTVTDLSPLDAASVDYAFASNLLEHLTQAEAARMLAETRRVLRAGGTLTLVQPNWRDAWRHYFDDYTHVTPWSHVSLADFLAAHGWTVLEVRPRFLPLTLKSRLPVHPWLVLAWLRLPVKPFGGQMLIRACPA